MGLLNPQNEVACRFGLSNGRRGIVKSQPRHTVRGTEGDFVYLLVRWLGRIAAKGDPPAAKGIGCTKERAHIVRTSNVFEDDPHGRFGGSGVFFPCHPTEFRS